MGVAFRGFLGVLCVFLFGGLALFFLLLFWGCGGFFVRLGCFFVFFCSFFVFFGFFFCCFFFFFLLSVFFFWGFLGLCFVSFFFFFFFFFCFFVFSGTEGLLFAHKHSFFMRITVYRPIQS